MVKHYAWKLIVAVALAAILVAPGVSATSAVFQSPPPVPPPNDNFVDALTISGDSYNSGWIDVSLATTEVGELTASCGYSIQHTIWYAFTAPSSGQISLSVYGDYYYYSYGPTIGLNVYQGPVGGFPTLEAYCTTWSPAWGGGSLSLTAQAGATYYFQVATTYAMTDNQLVFNFQFTPPPPPPANDNFADAELITALPYNDNTDMTSASSEVGEPQPSCGYLSKSIWYAYTPTESGSLAQQSYGPGNTIVAIYSGSSLDALEEVTCRSRYGYDSSYLLFHVDAGMTYYLQVWTDSNVWIPFYLQVTPLPNASFYYNPYDPTVFDTVNFWDNSYDPLGVGIQSHAWNFGDGATATGCCVFHRYAKDGDYSVNLTVTTYDGRTASTTQLVRVKTHDVAIAKFTVPQSASSGQTRQIVVGLNSKRYVEDVEVQLYKSTPNGWQWIGTLKQTVPVRPSNRTTDFLFSYTFTKEMRPSAKSRSAPLPPSSMRATLCLQITRQLARHLPR